MQITIERTKKGLPAPWECGGGKTNTGSAQIIANADGTPKKPVYIRRRGSLACFESGFLLSKNYERNEINMELSFEGHFLDSDKEKAFAEMMCIVDCLHRIGDKIHQQDYAGALVHIDNFRRSVAELKRLNDRKKIYEQVRDLLNDMIEDGDSNG